MSDTRYRWVGVAAFGVGMLAMFGFGRFVVASDTTPPSVVRATVATAETSVATLPPIASPVTAVPQANATTTTAGTDGAIETAFGPEPHPLTAGAWRLAFADEFDGPVVDADLWTTCHWWDDDGCSIATNNELEWYQPGNVSLLNGALRLTARREATLASNGTTFAYTSGMVSSGRNGEPWQDEPRFAFTHGYVEMRARIPAGAGLWPSFWLLPETHRSEPQIDIMAVVGDSPSLLRVHTNYIEADGTERSDGTRHSSTDLSEDWHVFGLLWEEHRMVWYLDGEKFWTTTDPLEIPNEPMYLIASLAVGGDYAGPPDATTAFPATFHIDYMRVWQASP